MGEFSASDCSWKKMVIAKANNKWSSTIKTEQIDADSTSNTTGFSLGVDLVPFGNIKQENDELCVNESYQNVHLQHEPVAVIQEMIDHDPLFVEENVAAQRQRRRGSAPKSETSVERAARLAKMSAYAAQRLANETPDQRATRLKRMSEYAAKRLSQETNEQRAKRLARMSAYAAQRLARETPEQRRARLTRMSAYAARRHALKKVRSPGSSDSFNSLSDFNQQITKMMPDQS